MKPARYLLPVLVLASCTAWAGEPEFPGLKAIMSETEWQRAKLDRLDPEDVRLINEAFARYLKEGEISRTPPAATSSEATANATPSAPAPARKRSFWKRFGLPGAEESKPANSEAATAAAPSAPAKKRSLWERFGLPEIEEKKPSDRPVMHAKVLAWKGTNGFVLDNDQVWEGLDPIRDELVGHDIGIMEGRFGSFLLVVDGVETDVRLHRVK